MRLRLPGAAIVGVLAALCPSPYARAQSTHPGQVALDGSVYTAIYVSLSDPVYPYQPRLPVVGMPVIVKTTKGDSLLFSTDAAGSIYTLLKPGTYRFVTPRPALWQGKRYRWSVASDVSGGRGVVELSVLNAISDAKAASGIPVAVEEKPPPQPPSHRPSAAESSVPQSSGRPPK